MPLERTPPTSPIVSTVEGLKKMTDNSENNEVFLKKKCESCTVLHEKVNHILDWIRKNDIKMEKLVNDVKDIKGDIEENRHETKLVIEKSMHTVSKTETYADKVKKSKNSAVVIIKPKENKQNSEKTEEDIKKSIDPISVNIDRFRKINNGGIVIECKDVKSTNDLKEIAVEKLGEKYKIQSPTLFKPKIKIIGISENLSDAEIEYCLKNQNKHLENKDIKLMRKYKTVGNKISAIIELDEESFEECMNLGRLKIKWEICRIYEELNVYMCHKCCGFNHKASECKNKEACKKCAGEHDLLQCKSDEEKCINCKIASEKYGLKLDINHRASSWDCAVFKRKIDIGRRQVKYTGPE